MSLTNSVECLPSIILGVKLELGGFGTGLAHVFQVAIRNQLEAHQDQTVVDLALAVELGLFEVLLGQRELHLLETVVVHSERRRRGSRTASEPNALPSSTEVATAWLEWSELSTGT